MAKRDISADRLMSVLRYEPDTGLFTWITDVRQAKAGDVAGFRCNEGYSYIQIDSYPLRAHRLAFLYMTGSMPDASCVVDHINGDRSDNRWQNLRVVSQSGNQHNRRLNKNSSTGLMGVGPSGYGGFRAKIKVGGKYKHIGTFKTKEEAYEAYLQAKRKLHSGCLI